LPAKDAELKWLAASNALMLDGRPFRMRLIELEIEGQTAGYLIVRIAERVAPPG
jgi:hypothetical protein